MLKKIGSYIIAFLIGAGSILLFIIRGRASGSSISGQSDIDKNNSRIRQGFKESGQRISKLRKSNERREIRNRKRQDIIKKGRGGIEATNESVSDIIANAKRSGQKPTEE